MNLSGRPEEERSNGGQERNEQDGLNGGLSSGLNTLQMLHDRAVELFYRWHAMDDSFQVVDFDFRREEERAPVSVSSREDLLIDFEQLNEALQSRIGNNHAVPHFDFVAAKVNAACWYLRAQGHGRLDFFEYVENTMGFRPAKIDEKDIAQGREELFDTIREEGFGEPEAFLQRAEEGDIITDKARIRELFAYHENRVLPKVQQWLEIDTPLRYSMKFVEKDVYWYNWIRTDDHGDILLEINVFPKNRWNERKIENLVAHELGAHALQALSWQSAIERGSILPACGLMCVVTPEQFSFEGLAQTIGEFCPNLLSTLESPAVERSRQRYVAMVEVNKHIDANTGVPFEYIAARYGEAFPWRTHDPEFLKGRLSQLVENPLLRTYQHVYAPSYLVFSKLAETLRPQSALDFIRKLYREPVIAQQILETYQSPGLWPYSASL